MKISVLIAHYNNWNYLQDCLKSIENQTYQNFEIVIVDDCSTEVSFDLLENLALNNPKIKVFKNSENKKVGFTKKRCVAEATGEICGFLDPDDLIAPNALELVVDAYKDHNVIATYSKIKLINPSSEEIGIFKHSKKIKNSNRLFFNINFEVAHFFTFKKDFYLKTEGINDQLIICEDQDLYMKLYEIGNFKFIDEFLYFYRIHDKGISQNKEKTEQQRLDWHNVLLATCNRRNITNLYGKSIHEIHDLPSFIFNKENTLLKKIVRKLS